MHRHTTRLSRTMLSGGIILLFAGMMVLAGCSSDDNGPAAPPAPVLDPEQAMFRMQEMARDVVDMDIGDLDDIALDDEVIAAMMEMLAGMGFELPANGEMPDIPPVGNIDERMFGLWVRGSWNLNEDAMNLRTDLRVSGTLQDTESDLDGTATDVTVTIRITGGNGTINVTGWITPSERYIIVVEARDDVRSKSASAGSRINVSLKLTLSDQGSNKQVRVEARVTQAGLELFFADVRAVFDPFGDDDSGTINGTVRIIDQDYPPHRATVTFTNLRVDGEGDFLSGQVVISDSAAGLTTTLTVRADGSLHGPIRDSAGNIVGYMTVTEDDAIITPV